MASDTSTINFLLLVELIVVVIAASAFLFYWNRLLGSLVALLIRAIAWRSHSAYVTIGSLQISPLAGRISFRDIEYHSSNLSVRALHGHITFRYWIFRVRQEADTLSDKVKRNRLPCRIFVYSEGVECFVFNRTPAYEAIVERMKKHEDQERGGSEETLAKAKSTDSTTQGEDGTGFGARLRRVAKSATSGVGVVDETGSSEADSTRKPTTDPHALPLQPKPVKTPSAPGVNWLREALPLELHVVNGSLILGSDSTPTVMVGSFQRTDGTLEITDSRSACDEYKLSVNLNFEQPTVLLRTNVDYSGPILAHGKKVYDTLYKEEPNITKQAPSALSSFFGFHTLAKRFAFIRNPKFSSPPVAGLPTDRPWKGLARYRTKNNTVPKPPTREEKEYAKVTTLVKADSLEFTYFADTPGPVPLPSEAAFIDETDEFGNVDLPPEYGIDLTIRNGIVNYGPWADRQRDALQRTFAPSIFFDSEPKPQLKPGDLRIHSNLIVNVQFAERTTLRIPTREPSKDWEHEHKTQEDTRTYGWLDVVVGSNSSITYTQSQFATKRGYDAILVLHLDTLSISSSVNYLPFLDAKTCKLSMTMPTPLSWNARRDWGLDITMDTPQVCLLRDHVQLISDLAKDWSSGATGDFHHFVPNHYNFRVTLLNYGVHLCLNDFNIIDAPLSREQNSYMDISGPRMESYVAVSVTQYRPDLSTIPFTVKLHDATVAVSLPTWDTHRSFSQQEAFEIGKIGQVSAEGSYTFYSTPHPDHQEMLTLHLEGKQVAFKALGWVLRRLFCTKDNYFGGFTQFATSGEFLERFDHDPASVGDPVEQKYRPGRSDAFAVEVTMNVEESLILMSDEIFGCERGIAMPVPQLQMALKSGEHFMDLSLDAMPTYIVASDDLEETYRQNIAPPIKAKEAIFIEGLELRANRLFGPQPRATTYLCLWELVAPRITAFLSPVFLETIKSAVSAVEYNFTDIENAPASFYIPKTPPDVTFFKLGIDHIAATLFADDTAVSVDMHEGVNLDTSSLATRSFSSAVGMIVPSMTVSILEYDSYRRKWLPTGVLHTSLSLDVFNAPAGWQEKAEKQQQFLRVEDGPTQRIWYMYREGHDRSHGHHINNVYLPIPRPINLKESDEASFETSSMDYSHERGPFIDYSSSGPSGDDGSNIELQGRTPGRKRSRSFSVVPDSRRSSLGDESDSVSEASDSTASTSATSSMNPGYDMAAALADRIKMFRSTQEHVLPVFPAWQDEGDSDIVKTPIQRSMAEGTIFRLSVPAIEVDLGVKPIQNAATLMRAIESVSRSPEIRLDQLLISHIEAIKDEGKPKDAALIDVTAPAVKIRLTTKIDQERVDTIEAALRGVSGSVLVVPESGSRPKELDVALGGRSMSLTVSTPNIPKGQVSLLGRDSLEVLTGISAPVLKAQLEGLQVGFSQSTDQQMRGKAALIDVTAVTPAAVCLIDIAAAWRKIASGLQGNHKSGSSPAQLIRGIIEEANSNQSSSTSPSFVFEGGYQLHAKDQRSIRRDPGWLMIARLRHWLRHMNQESLYQREADSDGNTAEWIISEMVRLEDAFCGDEALVKAQPFVRKALQGSNALPRTPDQRPKSSQGQSIFVKLGTLALRHHGRLLQSGSVASSVFQLFSASAGVQKSVVRQNEQQVEHLRVLLAVRQTTAELHDSILPAVQDLLKLARTPDRKDAEVAILNPDSGRLPTTILILDVQLENMQLSILAGGLRLRLAANNFQHASARRASRRGMEGDEDGRLVSHDTVFVCCDGIELALLQPQDDVDAAQDQPDRVVALLNLKGVRIKVDDRALGVKNKPTLIKMVFGVQNVDFDSRPQLRAFLTFARDWQKRHISRYRPIIHDIRYLVSQKKAKIVPDSSIQPDLNLDLAIGSVNLQVRAAKAVWLRWEIGKIYISRHGCSSDIEFGVRIAPQVVGAYSSMKKTKDRDVSSIKLPSLTAIGFHRSKHGRPHISATITLGFFVGVLKPAILDRLLSLHQRLGNDIMHIVQEYRDIIQEERSRPSGPGKSTSPGQDAEQSKDDSETQDAAKKGLDVLMDLQVSVSGIRFGLRADDVTTTLLLEALALRGAITNASTENAALRWRAKVEHFGLSLGHLRSAEISDDTEPIRKHRSAYMVLDVEVQETPGHQAVASQLNVSLNRVHTVMHVAALSELSDLVRSWQSDIHILRDNRATEVAEVKSTTTKLLKKFEAADKTTQLEESWFASRLFTVQVVGFGVAIPLDEAAAIDFSHREGSLVPALLFSVRVVSFQNRKNETARFKVQRMALQFLEKFDQGAPEHFMGDYHPSINRMLLPSLDSEAQMSSLPDVWILSAHSSATDFKLSLAPDVVTGVFKLIDLYEHGKDRLAELEKHYRAEMAKRELLDSVHAKYEETPTPSPARPRQRIVIRMSYTFNSGIVELHRSPESPATPNGQGSRGRATWHDSFILPTISVWTDYAGPKVQPTDDDSDDGAGMLVFNAAVHESRNTLRPTILPFFVDLVNRLERRHQSKPRRTSFASAERKAELVAASVSESTLQVIAPSPGSKIRLRLTLRIDRSELRLSCAPDSNAYVDLKWESGGFMSSGTIGCSGDEVSTFSGSISGVTASLSHEFADQGRSCVEAGAKDMAFSVAFCPRENSVEKGLSIVVDTQLSGQFRLDAFSAWLIFTSVWIDNAPSLDVPLRAAIPEAASSTSHVPAAGDVQRSMSVVTDETESSRRRKLPLTAMVRFRSTVLDANIAISKAKLDITPIILRTVSNGEKTEVDLKVGKTSITAKGDISGDLVSDKLVFNTMRRSSRASEQSDSTVLSMSIDAGDLRGNLFLGEVNILRLHLEPAFVSLADDWKDFQGDDDPGSQVSLAFSVRAGNFAGVLRLLAIPRLLGNLYSVLDMVDSQQRIAMQRSEIFKAHQRRKKEPSPVTAAILQTARRASAASPAHIRTAQTMRFDLAGIDIGVFNEDHESGGHIADFYRFIVGKVEADLTRKSSMEGVPLRDLGLLVSAVQWDSSDGARVAAKEKASMDARQLIDLAWRQGHKSVASLPSMTMKMKSQEISNPPVLDFDFDLVWGETDGDIGILPNFFEQAISAFRKLIKGIDEQELARQRRIDPSLSPNLSKSQRKCPPSEDAPARKGPTLEYRPRDPTWADDPPLPKLKQLGESTREAATFIPRIKSATKELPVLSHRFVTLPLEDGMDLLLKLYEKQLPERSA